MAESTAWLLPLQGALRAAVGEWELVHLIEAPVLLDIPVTPFHCRQVLLWENRILPALDLAAWLMGQPAPRGPLLAGIFAYQEQAEAALDYGVLLLGGVPARRVVDDKEACALPAEPTGWQAIAISCFGDSAGAVPILDLPYIFSGALCAATSRQL